MLANNCETLDENDFANRDDHSIYSFSRASSSFLNREVVDPGSGMLAYLGGSMRLFHNVSSLMTI